jgi:hypothetical protein
MRPEERAAALLVERLDLTPPIDVKALVAQFADFEICDWPFEKCDGVAVLSAGYPKIFVSAKQPWRRERFTVAHELGHVLLGWHVDTVRCHPSPESYTGDVLALGVDQEGEANRFASHLLVPDRFLEQFRHVYGRPPEMLDMIHQAGVSAAAGVIALSRALLPGYVFVVPGLDRIVTSSGTRLGSKDLSVLKSSSIDHGIHPHQDKAVRWFQLAESPPELVVADVSDDATSILKSVVLDVYGGHDEKHVFQSVNGIIGAALGQTRSIEPAVILGILVYKFKDRPSLRDLTMRPEFSRFLRIKAVNAASRNKKRAAVHAADERDA